jgi:serine/threonine protein kinase
MAVDAKRVEIIFQTARQSTDPVQQAAILDRECAADAETRQCVEELLRADHAALSSFESSAEGECVSASSSTECTVALDPTNERDAEAEANRKADETEEDDEPLSLDFLEPSTRAESLGSLGHYEVLEVLGRGGFGIVMRALDEKLQRMVAIKVLSPHLASTSPARKRFLREARASARIRHENVVQIYAVEEQPLPYLVMEYVPGQTLQQKLDHTGPLEVGELLSIGVQIARGLAAAHGQGLIHRDIKPCNILLESGPESRVKITDFGLARTADDASVSKSGMVVGTPLYMAPEQAQGDPLDHRVDLFSLGSVLYTLASGRPPFRAATPLAVLKRVAEDTPRPIRDIIPEVPLWLCDLISRLHAKDPARRFQSAAEVADLLSRHLDHWQQSEQVTRVEEQLNRGEPAVESPRRKSRWVVIGGLTAAALVVLVALYFAPHWWSAGGIRGDDEGQEQASSSEATAAPRRYVLQGRPAVRDVLIDNDNPAGAFGREPRENPLRRMPNHCNAFLVHFDLSKLGVTPRLPVARAMLSFYVWDPSTRGRAKVCAFPMKTAWDEATATWRQPSVGKTWKGGNQFSFGTDTGLAGASVVVEPDNVNDTVDPPVEYQLDVTALVRAWLQDGTPNYGLAIAPVTDAAVDDGESSRFQVCASEYKRVEYTPKLTVELRQ